jgi:dTDP-4-amino-4,6-dideoxygalactose transaminase
MPVYSPEEFLDLLDQNGDPTNMAVPFLDLKAQHHQIYNEVDDRITDIIGNTAFILGKHVEEFEERFAEAQGARYCVGVSSGTDALHAALLALGIGAGDRVVVPVNTFVATAEAVSLCGAEPVFVDCDEFYNLDVGKVKRMLEIQGLTSQESITKARKDETTKLESGERITNNKSQITCIIPVYLYGQPANMDGIMALAEEYGIHVVEDCAQAHLARYDGKLVGNWGEFGAFSFYPGKNLGAYGEAGALVTNDEELYQRARMIRQHGEIERYCHQVIGHNYRMEAIQGAVLSTKLNHLSEWTEKRRENAKLYSELLAEVEGVKTPEELGKTYCVYHLYVIRVDNRDDLRKYLQEKGIETGLHYPTPLHLQEAYAFLGHKEGDFPMAEKAAKCILSLPMYPELTEGQIRYVVEKIKEYY